MIIKCKMCGGDLAIEEGSSIAVCEYCGRKQTLPKLDNERRANLYDRANHFRRNNEFDKAMGIYEQILNEDGSDAEAYWSLVLCRYGIEYVEDPATRKRVPTVNRAQFTSIFADEDYKAAIAHADALQKSIYEDEAQEIDGIQKGILAISQKEEPFDVFICYKETDNSGRRTPDSVLANDLYHQLTNEGFKVFFSRITLEDKLGTAYEPYIFAALNSAKVMVVLGTKPEYFNAVWVKNEWSRYLALVKQSGGKKVLIPAYKDMDPYDLPEEFSHLQAQDMAKLGFMQDLIRGIKKIADVGEPKAAAKEQPAVGIPRANVAPLLERAFLFLEDGKWKDADIYCEKVLDIDPKNAEAYLGKLMAELQVRSRKQLVDCPKSFDDNENYEKVLRFGSEKLEAEMRGYIDHINERNENARLSGIYKRAIGELNGAKTEHAYKSAASIFETIPGFKDADALAKQCLEKAEVCRKDAIYDSAKSQMTGESIIAYEAALKAFGTIRGWKDADEQINSCKRKIEELKAKAEAERLEAERRVEEQRIAAAKAAKKRRVITAITTTVFVAGIAFLILWTSVIVPKQKLNKAMDLLISGDHEAANALLSGLGNNDMIAESKYNRAITYIDSGNYEAAYMLLNGLEYKDSAAKLSSIEPQYQKILLTKAQVGSYIYLGSYEQDNDTLNGKEDIEWLVLAKADKKALVVSKYALDCQKYNSVNMTVTWETCSLRKWLNETFINSAFSSEEQKSIVSSTVTADKNPNYSTSPGSDTLDKVFLLSIEEVNKYFGSDEARKCGATDYAKAQGAYTNNSYSADDKATCWWWLRSPAYKSNFAAYVYVVGSVYDYGRIVSTNAGAVRPAMWIDLEP